MANMIKFYRGLLENLPATGDNGALYITTDEGAIYYGTGTGMKRLGDFIQVDNVAALPEKAHESCLYYCVAENILAKWNGTEWKQINKQPTANELKTLLGLGSLAYLSEVSESNLNSALKEKVNAAAEGNHSHANKTVLDGITADKVTAWDSAEQNAKDYADGLNTAMDTRVKAVEADKHTHSNKALLDTYTQTEENLADAVAKKHEHSNKTELDKITAGDVAKWNGVVADHLTSADKTSLEDSIGDVSTALGEEVTRAKAAEKANADAITGIKNGTNINDFAGVETELAKKVDKVEGKDLIATSEIERLATLANYDDTQVKADIAKKADAETMTTELGKKVDKVEGYSLVSDDELERLSKVDNYDDTALAGRVTTAEGKITALETESAKHALKTEVEAVDAKFANYVTSESYATDKQGIDAAIADRYTKEEADGKFALITDAYDDTELAGRVKAIEDDYLVEADKTELSNAITAEKERAEGIEAGLRSDVDTIKGDYLKSSDKTELEGKIQSNADAISLLTNGASAEEIDGVNDLINYVKEHGTEVTGMKADIAANAKAITDQATSDAATYETKTDAAQKLTDAKAYTDAEVAKDRARLDTLEAIDHEAYKSADATLKTELQAEIDADVKVVNDALEAYKTSNDAEVAKKANSADVYAKTETYTKSEIETLLQWGEF